MTKTFLTTALCSVFFLGLAGCDSIHNAIDKGVTLGTNTGVIKSGDGERIKQASTGIKNIRQSAKEMSIIDEFAVGEATAIEAFSSFNWEIVESKALQTYLNLVGQSVARNSDRTGIPYYFLAVKDPQVNAFGLPGGLIFVTSGLLKKIETEDQLAVVLAHEVSHVAKKHALGQIKTGLLFKGMTDVASAGGKGKAFESFSGLINDLVKKIIVNGLGPEKEHEADKLGLKYAYDSGYNPAGYLRVLGKLRNKGSVKQGWESKTHPPITSRIAKVKAELRKYKDASPVNKIRTRRWQKIKALLK